MQAKFTKNFIKFFIGDFTRVGDIKDVINFNEFLGNLDFKYKIVIAGNHDLSFDTDNFE